MKILLTLIILNYSLLTLAAELKMSGDFEIKAADLKMIIGNEENSKSSFKVLKTSKKYQLKVSEGKGSCLFKVTKISAPQQTRGLIGNISTYGKKCIDLSDKSLWNQITSISIRYHYSPKGELVGFALASTLDHTFRMELDKVQLQGK